MIRKTLRRRTVITAALLATGCLAAALFVVGSIWSEDHFPSDGPDASSLTRARGVLTRPVVSAIAGHVRRRVRSVFARRQEMTGLSLEETIARLRDEGLTDEQRGLYALRLARVGSPQAVAALRELLSGAPAEHRAFLAQLLGSTGDPSVAPWLRPLLCDTDETVVVAALRGLCALRGYDATDDIAPLLRATDVTSRVRAEAAIALGQVGSEAARRVLTATLAETRGCELAQHVLDGLGHFRFREVEATFEDVVADPATSADERIVAVEALFHSTPDAVPFLLDVARTHADAATRASAAWAIGAFEGDVGVGPELVAAAVQEPDADVRRRLYESLVPQRRIPAGELLPLVAAETDVAARVAGANAVGEAVGRDAPNAAVAVFDEDLVPDLTHIAMNPNSLNVRMRAVFALRRARTAAARAALSTIAGSDCEQVAAAARNGLPDQGSD